MSRQKRTTLASLDFSQRKNLNNEIIEKGSSNKKQVNNKNNNDNNNNNNKRKRAKASLSPTKLHTPIDSNRNKRRKTIAALKHKPPSSTSDAIKHKELQVTSDSNNNKKNNSSTDSNYSSVFLRSSTDSESDNNNNNNNNNTNNNTSIEKRVAIEWILFIIEKLPSEVKRMIEATYIDSNFPTKCTKQEFIENYEELLACYTLIQKQRKRIKKRNNRPLMDTNTQTIDITKFL